ncbi:hypothetical protein WAF17_18020 [Bernardetia sp. ABR2-2B]|uniref:hypothetical protein n=1 Tax=Bernardetia sp. ABR2-2B TaxID=3127472 RepID=UPI0030CFDF1C
MKTNKKLKLNTKKVVILSDEQQDSVQGGTFNTRNADCVPYTTLCPSNLGACHTQPVAPWSCI